MKKVEVSEDLIKQLHKEAWHGTRALIEKELPELFGVKLEVGKWYKSDYFLICYAGDDRCFGFSLYNNNNNEWLSTETHNESMHKNSNYRPATNEEVIAALSAEAEKRGYVDGVTVRSIWSGRVYPIDIECVTRWDVSGFMYRGVYILNTEGKWAEIIPKEMTKEQIEAALGYKVKIV